MNEFWFYPITLGLFVLGVLALIWMERKAVREKTVWMITAALSFASFFFLSRISNPHGELLFADFNKAYFAAGHAVVYAPEKLESLVAANFFVNLPILAWLFSPFAIVNKPRGSAWLFAVIGFFVTLVVWRMLARIAELNLYRKAMLFFVFAINGPLMYNFKEGNTSHMILAMIIGVFILLRRDRELLAGFLMGVAALIKLPLLLFGVYFAARRRWRVAGGMVLMLFAVGALSLTVFGWSLHERWYAQCVEPFARNPMGAYNVQSIYGFLARVQFGDLYLTNWYPHEITRQKHFLMTAMIFFMYGVSILAMLRKAYPVKRTDGHRGPGRIALELEFLIVLVLTLVASPMTWSHYYLWLLMPSAFMIGRSGHFSRDRGTRFLGWVSMALATLPVILPYTKNQIVMDFYTKFFLSHFLFAGILMLSLLVWSRWKIIEP